MKKIILLISLITLSACSSSDDSTSPDPTPTPITDANIAFSFSHNWDGTAVTNSNFNTIQYTNANGEEMSIEKLRYLISNITFQKINGEVIEINGYNLVDVTNNENIFAKRYNDVTNEVNNVYQSGFFPDILYRVQF